MNSSSEGPKVDALAELYFTDLNDSPSNPRLGIGYELLKQPIRLHASKPTTPRPGDEVVLYWDDREVQRFTIPATSPTRLEFSVLANSVRPPSGTTYYTYQDLANGTAPEESPRRTIPINILVPGGPGPDPQPPFNDSLLPCTVIPNPVISLTTPVTVKVPAWLNMEVGDELFVNWGNVPVAHPKVTNPGVDQQVTIPISALQAAGTSPGLPVTYEIRDIVDNHSRLSRPTLVPVQLPAPAVHANGAPATVIDLKGLTKLDVIVPNYGMQAGDSVTILWSGSVPRQKKETVTVVPLTVPMDLAWARENKDQQVTISYVITRGGKSMTSSPHVVQVKESQDQLILPAPGVNDLRNGELDYHWLRDNRNAEATVVVPRYTGMQVGHTVTVTWSNNVDWDAPAQTVRTLGPMQFKIRTIEIVDTIGTSATVGYKVVTQQNSPPVSSDTMRCRVKDNPPPFQSMPPPRLQTGNTMLIPKAGQTSWRTRVHWHEPLSRFREESPILYYRSNGQPSLEWQVPAAWVTANRGKLVYITYSMSVGDGRICISRYLRYTVPT